MSKTRFLTGAFAAILAGSVAVSASADNHKKMDGMKDKSGQQMTMMQKVQNWNQDKYINYQKAVAAHEYCRGRLSEPAMRAIVSRIEEETGEPMSPGEKLTIMNDAKWEMKSGLIADGCYNTTAKSALKVFDDNLARAAHAGSMMMDKK